MDSFRSLALLAGVFVTYSLASLLSVRQESDHISAYLLAIFNETSVGCPNGVSCAAYPNQTAITVYNNATAEYQAFMDANVPGGQNVYVKESGALSFTEPHTEYVFPPRSYTNGFSYSTNENNITFISFTGGGASTFFACPTSYPDTPSYQVFADVVGFNSSVVPAGTISECLGFGIITEPIEGDFLAAFQYE